MCIIRLSEYPVNFEKLMKVSIITVCYNSEKYLRFTIESVLNQTYRDIEYIVVDGGSTDTTLDIIKLYEPLFNGRMHWISEPDNGLYDAMNKGIKMADGDIVGFINSDDLFAMPDSIERIASIFNEKNVACTYADLYYVSQDNTDKIIRYWYSGERGTFSKGWHPAHPTFYVKKAVYQQFGSFNLAYKFAADFELMLRFVEKHKISTWYLPEVLVKMRLGGTTNKNLKNIIKGNIECYRAFKENAIPVSIIYPLYRIFPKITQFFHKNDQIIIYRR